MISSNVNERFNHKTEINIFVENQFNIYIYKIVENIYF